MREISRRTEGPSKPPTLRIYLSFSLLLLPTSCVLPFSQLTRLFLRWALRHLFVPAPTASHLFLFRSYPSHFLLSILIKTLKFPTFSVPGFAGGRNETGASNFYALTFIIAGLSCEMWSELKEIVISGGSEHLAAGYVIKTCRLQNWRCTQARQDVTLSSACCFPFNCFGFLWLTTCPAADVN